MPAFRASAFGYFGHMWELYAFWTLVPFLLALVLARGGQAAPLAVSAWSFAVIGAGALGCVLGGRLSRAWAARASPPPRSRARARCASLFPLAQGAPVGLLLAAMLFWGVAGRRRFAAVLRALGTRLPAGAGRQRARDPEQHRLLHHRGGDLRRDFVVDGAGANVAWLLLPGPVLGLLGIAPLVRLRGEPAGLR